MLRGFYFMKVLHLVMSYHPNSLAGGPVYNVYAYSQGLLQKGHRVAVCCSDRLDVKKRVQIDTWERGVSPSVFWDGIQVTYVRSFHLIYGGYGTIVSTALWPYLKRNIEKYDLIHIHGAWNTFNLMAGLAARQHHVPYVIQLHNTFPIRSRHIISKKVFHNFLRIPWLNHASAIIALTVEEQEEYLQSRPQDKDKVFVVPCIKPNVPVTKKGTFRHEWGISTEDYLVLYLGRLHEGKGIEHLIQSLRLLQRNTVRLAIVGPDAGYKANLVKLVQKLGLNDQILLTGPIYGDYKFSAYRDADLFALPSMFEQLPVSALEAALCEVPLLVSDRCGMTKMIMKAKAGIIVPYGSPQALARAIQILWHNPDKRCHMGRNAKEMVEKYCDPESVMTSLEHVYHKACSYF
jgi:glycosyltransferase involved in cell wall biosynthesis